MNDSVDTIFYPPFTEIDDEGETQTEQAQVREGLGFEDFVVIHYGLTFDNYGTADPQINPEWIRENMPFVRNRNSNLTFNGEAPVDQLPDKSFLIDTLKEAGTTKSSVNFQSRIDDMSADLVRGHVSTVQELKILVN